MHKRARALAAPFLDEAWHEKNSAISNELLKQIPDSLEKLQKVSNRITELPLIGGNHDRKLIFWRANLCRDAKGN